MRPRSRTPPGLCAIVGARQGRGPAVAGDVQFPAENDCGSTTFDHDHLATGHEGRASRRRRPSRCSRLSIVQVESRATADGPKVARVLDNRLAQGIMLQLDSTVSYVTGKLRGRHHLGRPRQPLAVQHVCGTPARPPGRSATRAWPPSRPPCTPATGTWLWFVTVNPTTGETRFESTEAAKIADTKLFQAWCAAHVAACRGTG